MMNLNFAVVNLSGGVVNTWSMYPNEHSEYNALKQANIRWALGLGRHGVEVWPRGACTFTTRPIEVIRLHGPERREFELEDSRSFPYRYE